MKKAGKKKAAKQQSSTKKKRTGEHLKPYRWKPGQSGNPKGRKPKDRVLTELAREYLEQKCQIQVGKIKPGTKTWKEMIVLGWLVQMVRGNSTALAQFLDRVEGKPTTTIDFGDESLDAIADAASSFTSRISRLAERVSEKKASS